MWSLSVFGSALSADVREAIAMARGCGAPGVQLAVGRGPDSLRELTRSGRRDLIKSVAASDLSLTSLATTCGRSGIAPGSDVDQVIDHLHASLQLAADLGRVVLCVDVGGLPPPPPPAAPVRKPVDPLLAGAILLPETPPPPPTTSVTAEPRDEAHESLLDEALREIGRSADRFGVRVAWRSSLGSWRALERALTAAACPMFGVDLDPVALLQESGEPDEAIGQFAGRIWHVRARDARRGSGGRTAPTVIGQGSTNWERLRSLLEDASFSGPVAVDPTELSDRVAGAWAGLAVLRGLIEPRA